MNEQLHFHFLLSCTGEGNGNPLQYACLENPRYGSLVGCRLWGHTESDTTEATEQQQQQTMLSVAGALRVSLDGFSTFAVSADDRDSIFFFFFRR